MSFIGRTIPIDLTIGTVRPMNDITVLKTLSSLDNDFDERSISDFPMFSSVNFHSHYDNFWIIVYSILIKSKSTLHEKQFSGDCQEQMIPQKSCMGYEISTTSFRFDRSK